MKDDRLPFACWILWSKAWFFCPSICLHTPYSIRWLLQHRTQGSRGDTHTQRSATAQDWPLCVQGLSPHGAGHSVFRASVPAGLVTPGLISGTAGFWELSWVRPSVPICFCGMGWVLVLENAGQVSPLSSSPCLKTEPWDVLNDCQLLGLLPWLWSA